DGRHKRAGRGCCGVESGARVAGKSERKGSRGMSDELPEGWAEAPLAALTTAIQYGYTASAQPDGRGPRLLRITDIQDGRVDWSCVPGCDIGKADLEKYRLTSGDIVFARTGATTGKSFLIFDCPRDAVFASYLIRVKAATTVVTPEYLIRFFQSG